LPFPLFRRAHSGYIGKNLRREATMKSDKPVPPANANKPGVPRAVDLALDPLPVPDVSESDTDTAWGLWEATLEGRPSAKPADAPPDFEATQPIGLNGLPDLKP
jgi:hypothetical protein